MDEVTLDLQSFKALASGTRVKFLKSLRARGKTASELAKEAGVSVQAASQHLEKMRKADLVSRRARGKWVYYDLTNAGSGVIEPARGKVLLLLGASALAVLGGLWRLAEAPLSRATAPVFDGGKDAALNAVQEAAAAGLQSSAALDSTGLLLVITGSVLFGFFLKAWLSRRSP